MLWLWLSKCLNLKINCILLCFAGDRVSMFCTSKTTLMAGLITMVTLQLTIIGTCCACLIIYKKPCCPHLGKHIHNNDSKDRESITTTVSSNPNLYYHLNSNHQSHGHQQRHLQSSHSSLWANISRIEWWLIQQLNRVLI